MIKRKIDGKKEQKKDRVMTKQLVQGKGWLMVLLP